MVYVCGCKTVKLQGEFAAMAKLWKNSYSVHEIRFLELAERFSIILMDFCDFMMSRQSVEIEYWQLVAAMLSVSVSHVEHGRVCVRCAIRRSSVVLAPGSAKDNK